MPKHILAIDQGTTSSRALVFDAFGDVLGACQVELTQHYPRPGFVNHDANEIWDSVRTVAKGAIERSGGDISSIAGIGISNQRETTVVWDRATGTPVAPAIVWQSRESVPWVDQIRERGMSETYQQITGLVPDAYFSATKLVMLLDRDPELRKMAEAGEVLFGTVDSWLIWNLTGGKLHVTDVSNAARTMLFDIVSLDWSDGLLSDLAIPKAMLPTIVPSSGCLGEISESLFGHSIPIAGVAGDQHAALFGQRCFRPGDVKNTYGTGAFVLMNTGKQIVVSGNQLLSTVAWGVDQATAYALEGSVFVAGSAVQWLRDGLKIISTSSEVESLARSVPDNGGVVFVPAFVGLGAPHWNDSARGALFGLTRGTTDRHIARASLEAIALQVKEVIDAMSLDSGFQPEALRVDGGAAANDLLLQIQSDVLDIPVVRPANLETSAAGAAYLAGLGAGVWRDLDSLPQSGEEDTRFFPAMEVSDRDRLMSMWHQAVERSLDWESA